ncbi:hypothetical protein BSKO_07215 [Bryopsis sp. KO-2023]|nr:hypothetical protein BSKO_07215 [Bryopsis sp. KO-2023]
MAEHCPQAAPAAAVHEHTMETDSNGTNVSRFALNHKILNDLEEKCGSKRIPAGGGGGGSWGLMDMLGSATVYSGKGNQEGVSLEVCNTGHITVGGKRMIRAVARGIDRGQRPVGAIEGLGGTYFFKSDTGRKLAIFKPCDEEPLAPCNPKGFVGRFLGDPGLKATVRVGEAALREVAACLLDKERFSNVPTTVLCRASHPVFHYLPNEADPEGSVTSSMTSSPATPMVSDPMSHLKVGSMQQFVDHICDTSEMGTSRFSSRDVHKIGILDIRLFNTDRHAGNMLVRKPLRESGGEGNNGLPSFSDAQYELVPIDHGFCLPEALEPPYFEWLHWSQARLPFDEEELSYIENLDIEADKALLRRELPVLREEALRTMEVSCTLMKLCAAGGLSLNEIGEIVSRPLVDVDGNESELEKLCAATKLELFGESLHRGHNSWDSDSEESGWGSPMRGDDLQFAFDDVKDVDGGMMCPLAFTSSSMSSCHSPSAGLRHAGTLEAALECTLFGESGSRPIAVPSPKNRSSLCNIRTAQSMAIPDRFFDRPNPQVLQGTHSPKLAAAVAYPPPVEGAAPSHSDDIFSGMTDEQWQRFMYIFKEKVCRMLGSRRREGGQRPICRKAGSSSNLGYSCPRF